MNTKLAAALTAYIGAIVAANVMAAEMGFQSVGFGLMVPAGTFAAGFALLARDFVHRYAGDDWARWVLGAICVGALISFWVTNALTDIPKVDPMRLAIASAIAFGGSELLDLGVFAKMKRRLGFVPAIVVSNIASAPLDTVLFLWLSGFGLTWAAVGGQLVGKLVWATAVPVALYIVAHASVRRPVTA